MDSVSRFAAVILVLGASGCMVHVQAGSGTSAGTWNGGSSPPVQSPAPARNPSPVLAHPATPLPVTIIHPLPTGTVTREQVPRVPVRTVFGGPQTGALRGLVYYIPTDTMTLPDVSFMTPQAVTYTDQLNVTQRDYSEPVGGSGRFEFYAIQYTGTWTASKAGPYQFVLNSSDGSRLIIDDKLVIDNDGRHTPKKASGTITLAAGKHTIRVDYFKAYRWVVALELFVVPPGGQYQYWHADL